MKKFLFKIFVFFIAKILFLIILIVSFETHDGLRSTVHSSYLHGYNFILEKIRESKERKVIFVGGSNVGFGLNTKRIQDSLGIKTFNFGVHGGIGLKKPIEDITPHLNPIDIVIFSPEYSNFDLMNYSDHKYIVQFLDGLNFLEIKNFETLFIYFEHIEQTLRLYRKQKSGHVFNNYNFKWFNNNGDVIGHHNMERSDTIIEKIRQWDIKAEHLKKLKYFIENKLNEIEYYVIPPVTIEGLFSTEEKINLNQKLFKVFGEKYPLSIEDLTFGKDCFYDTEYHLNEPCKEKRTDIIIEFLNTIKKETQN